MRTTTYRQYIITGMNKKWKIFNFIWILAAVSSRIVYFFLSRNTSVLAGFLGLSPKTISDTYGYFEYAMIRSDESKRALDSGLSYGYGQNLSWLLRFVGNKTDAVCVYQMTLQILWLTLFFVGMSFLFGRMAGMIAGSILLLSPWILNTVFVICPENYYMLHWTVALVICGCLQIHVKNKGLNNWSRLCLIVMGFYLGVICIRNSIRFYLPLWLLCAVAGGIICQWLFNMAQRKKQVMKTANNQTKGSIPAKKKEKMPEEETQDNYFITEDGRKVRFIDNPLPGPKKHVKREMDFDLKDFDDLVDFQEDDDFDFKVKADDDFDF